MLLLKGRQHTQCIKTFIQVYSLIIGMQHSREDTQRRSFKLISYHEALAKTLHLLDGISPIVEEVDVSDAIGRALAIDIVSELDVPERDNAVYDGYVLHSPDTEDATLQNPVSLRVVGATYPGDEPTQIAYGEARFTATGGPIPLGDYALVKVEQVRRLDDKIDVCFPLKAQENVALAGEDVQKGMSIFPKGHILRPHDVGSLMGIEINTVKVLQRPTVAVISVGDELTTLKEKTANSTVNNYALIVSSLITEFGGSPKYYGIVRDDLAEIEDRISTALKETDMALTISGCSVGPKDLVPDAINALGRLVFHGIKLSPGKVVGVGVIGGKPVIMLPGHIASTFAGFYLFTVPIIARYLQVSTGSLLPVLPARLSKGAKTKYLPYFMRVHLKKDKTGLVALPIHGGSSRLNVLVESNGFTVIPANHETNDGDLVEVTLYSRLELNHID
jgi:molybdenum cofactor synthesis domain-containing protein